MKEDPPASGFWVAEFLSSATAGRGRQLLHRGLRRKRQAARVQGDGAADAEDRDDRAGRAAAGQEEKAAEGGRAGIAGACSSGLGVGGGFGWATGKGEVNRPWTSCEARPASRARDADALLARDRLLPVARPAAVAPFAGSSWSRAPTNSTRRTPAECGRRRLLSPGTYAFAGLGRSATCSARATSVVRRGIGGLGTFVTSRSSRSQASACPGRPMTGNQA